MYIYPENMTAKATLWLWELRDVAIIAAALLLAVFALVNTGFFIFQDSTRFDEITVTSRGASNRPCCAVRFELFRLAQHQKSIMGQQGSFCGPADKRLDLNKM